MGGGMPGGMGGGMPGGMGGGAPPGGGGMGGMGGGGMGDMFGPQGKAKLMANPRIAKYFDDPQFSSMYQMCQ